MMQVIISLDELNQILEVCRQMPTLVNRVNQLERQMQGIQLLYSEILESLRNK